MQYAVIFQLGAWRLLRGDAEIVSFTSFDLAARAARRLALTMSASGSAVELLLQDDSGELRSERFAAVLETAPLTKPDAGAPSARTRIPHRTSTEATALL